MKKKVNDEVSQYLSEMKKSTKNAKKSVEDIPPPRSFLKEMNEIQKFHSEELPKDYFVQYKEWIEKFRIWFGYLRTAVQKNLITDQKLQFNEIIRLIESEIPPKPENLSPELSMTIICYFTKRGGKFSKNDCIWIFSALASLNVLDSITPNEVAHIQSLSHHVYKNIQTLSKDQILYPYLAIILIIIQKYFNQ